MASEPRKATEFQEQYAEKYLPYVISRLKHALKQLEGAINEETLKVWVNSIALGEESRVMADLDHFATSPSTLEKLNTLRKKIKPTPYQSKVTSIRELKKRIKRNTDILAKGIEILATDPMYTDKVEVKALFEKVTQFFCPAWPFC